MQSAVEHVLSVLDRSHTPGRALEAAKQARTEGFAHVSLDLIYGTPTESDDDWRASLQAAISADVDHISAYALTVEPGTRMARQVARGELAMIDDDVLADRYQLADRILSEAGFSWYEISNWARTPGDRCRHNELYWRGGDWWGFGPGAHSHAGGVRWWNVKHPAAYARRLASGESPAQARELLGRGQRAVEDVMLRVRLVEGFPLDELDDRGRSGAAAAVAQGLLNPKAHHIGTAQLTLRGRLLTDTVVRMLSN
jgi:oxygen-independent coproporphyrinogen-3 oxidase